MTLPSKKSLSPLAPPAAFLSADDLRARTFIRHIEIHDTLDSTNNRAAELARDTNIELPALVVARHQTAGRGRGTNKWWSADGALTFSLLIDSAAHGIGADNWPQLSLTTAVAVCDALEAECREQAAKNDSQLPTPGSLLPAPCSIKWPNDVLIEGQKVAGILLESPGGAAPAKDRLIIGIGINVNNSWQQGSCDQVPNSTAMCDITGRSHDLQSLLDNILCAVEHRISQLAAGDLKLPISWQKLCCLTDQTITVTNHGRQTTGRCLGIASDGALVIQNQAGKKYLYSGSVTTRAGE
ncbi:MAG: biotin--[acetyl-CoA-carboxylase] ligase [Pirellulales bacterium]